MITFVLDILKNNIQIVKFFKNINEEKFKKNIFELRLRFMLNRKKFLKKKIKKNEFK